VKHLAENEEKVEKKIFETMGQLHDLIRNLKLYEDCARQSLEIGRLQDHIQKQKLSIRLLTRDVNEWTKTYNAHVHEHNLVVMEKDKLITMLQQQIAELRKNG